MPTHADFNQAVERLLGEKIYERLSGCGFTPHDFCREVSQSEFIGILNTSETKEADLELVRNVAKRLWMGDGVTGLLK